jgi:hypothetical protein
VKRGKLERDWEPLSFLLATLIINNSTPNICGKLTLSVEKYLKRYYKWSNK